MSARNFIGTLNNPDVVPQEYLERFMSKAVYVCGQLEKGKEGTVHLQFFIQCKDKIRATALKKICSKAHFEVVRVDNGAGEYCMKEDTRVEGPWEFGIKKVKRNNKKDWERVYTCA